MLMIIENRARGLFPEPLDAEDAASSISKADMVPGCQLVMKPAASMTITASVAPLGNDFPTEASDSSINSGHDSFNDRE